MLPVSATANSTRRSRSFNCRKVRSLNFRTVFMAQTVMTAFRNRITGTCRSAVSVAIRLGSLEAEMKRLVVVTTASMLASFALGAFTVQRMNAQTKPPVYFVVENEITDVQAYLKDYAVHARDMIKANGGRYLAAGDTTTFVGEPPKSRVAIFVFDDLQQI